MTFLTFVPFLEHVWQSTLVAAVICCLAWMCRSNRASVRHALWATASTKFLVPFSALMWVGGHLTSFAPSGTVADVSSTARDVWMPGTTGTLVPSPLLAAAFLPRLVLFTYLAGVLFALISWARAWQPLRGARRAATPLDLKLPQSARGVLVMSTALRLEPGIVGVWRPILLLPDGIVGVLSSRELDAIVEHELCHLRRRDNLTATVHMLVEAVFWFHPLVWWIERRMLLERERACDEEVLTAGVERKTYAQAILTVCRHYVESPLSVVSGVTGGGLARRIETIATTVVPGKLTLAKKAALAAVLIAAVWTPVALGAMPVGAIPVGAAGIVLGRDVAIAADAYPQVRVAQSPAAAPTLRAAPAPRRTPALPQDATIEGIVTDASFGQPLDGVAVEVEGARPDAQPRTTTTDGAGAYKIEGLQPGVYSVIFRLDDYVTFKREGLTVSADSRVVVSPALKEQRIRD